MTTRQFCNNLIKSNGNATINITNLTSSNPTFINSTTASNATSVLFPALSNITFTGSSSNLQSMVSPTSLLATGLIVMWSGAYNNIPSGWVICNGLNSTPDLRDKFIIGGGSSYAISSTGGANSTTLTISNLPSHTHTMSVTDDINTHRHDVRVAGNRGSNTNGDLSQTAHSPDNHIHPPADSGNNNGYSWYQNRVANTDHTHSFTTDTGTNLNSIVTAIATLPQFYTLVFIMKV